MKDEYSRMTRCREAADAALGIGVFLAILAVMVAVTIGGLTVVSALLGWAWRAW